MRPAPSGYVTVTEGSHGRKGWKADIRFLCPAGVRTVSSRNAPALVYIHCARRRMMSSLDYRLGMFAILCAIAGGCLVLLDVATTPLDFENGRVELAFFAPLLIWLVGRRMALWGRR